MYNYCNPRACAPRVTVVVQMAAPAEVSKKRSNFRIRQFKEKHHFNIAANMTLNKMVSFIILLIVRTAKIASPDRQTHTHTHTHAHTLLSLYFFRRSQESDSSLP